MRGRARAEAAHARCYAECADAAHCRSRSNSSSHDEHARTREHAV